jgi:hypothetical protein
MTCYRLSPAKVVALALNQSQATVAYSVRTVRLHVRQSNSAIKKPVTRRFPPPWTIEAFRQGIYALTSLVASLANKRIYEKRRCAPDKQKEQSAKKNAVLIHGLRSAAKHVTLPYRSCRRFSRSLIAGPVPLQDNTQPDLTARLQTQALGIRLLSLSTDRIGTRRPSYLRRMRRGGSRQT